MCEQYDAFTLAIDLMGNFIDSPNCLKYICFPFLFFSHLNLGYRFNLYIERDDTSLYEARFITSMLYTCSATTAV